MMLFLIANIRLRLTNSRNSDAERRIAFLPGKALKLGERFMNPFRRIPFQQLHGFATDTGAGKWRRICRCPATPPIASAFIPFSIKECILYRPYGTLGVLNANSQRRKRWA